MLPHKPLLAAALTLAGCQCGQTAPDVITPPTPVVVQHDGPNVLLVVLDTVRADHLTPYGYARETTPRLGAFAQEAVVYERAVSPGMWTVPSHASLFTGLPVSAHGTHAKHKWLDDSFTTAAEWFGQHGYGTYLFSANPFVGADTNLGQGFDLIESPFAGTWKEAAREATLDKVQPDDASNTLGPLFVKGVINTGRPADKVKDAGATTSKALLTWVDGRETPDAPWFAVLNYMEAHIPRIPSMEARKALFDDETIARQLATDQSLGRLLSYTAGVVELTDEELATITSTYDASLRDLDSALGALFDDLESRDLLDSTIVVITSDHGEHLGEHHKVGHKFSVYNPLVRVPLIIRHPDLPAARVAGVVSTMDVLATVTEIAGLEAPPGTQSRSLLQPDQQDGRAFSELVHATPQALKRVASKYKGFDKGPFRHTFTAVEGPDHKCIARSDGQQQLFAMADDALETTDLAAQAPDQTSELCGSIETWRAGFRAWKPSPTAKGRKGKGPATTLDAETKARLEMLGYLEAVDED